MRWPDDGENVKQNQTWTTISSAERSGKRFIYLYDTYKIYQIAVVFFFSPSNISFAFGSFWCASFKSRINHINLSVLRLLSQAKWTDQHFQYHFFFYLSKYIIWQCCVQRCRWCDGGRSMTDARTHAYSLTHTNSWKFHCRFISGFVLILGNSLFHWNFNEKKKKRRPASKVQTTKISFIKYTFFKRIGERFLCSNRIITLLVLFQSFATMPHDFVSYLNLKKQKYNSFVVESPSPCVLLNVHKQYHFNSHLYNISVNRFKGADRAHKQTHINAHAESSFTWNQQKRRNKKKLVNSAKTLINALLKV